MKRLRLEEEFENNNEAICGSCKFYNPYYVKKNGKEYMVHLGQCEFERNKTHVGVRPGKFPGCKNWKEKENKIK
ncbi:MAG: hypothetical protein HFE26_01220 [Clostridia bacterium]|nr:hypothetical protein [Clostridia bacterium]